MAIQRKPTTKQAQAKEKALDRIVSEAPDERGKPEREAKKVISLTVFPSVIKAVDRAAARRGMSRAAFFSMAVTRAIEDEENR
jgi:ribosome-binding protein aMBF1 (putative translation factor)